MGYSTDFNGILYFTKGLNRNEKNELEKFLGADCREHPEWKSPNLTFIDLEFSYDESGLEWDGSEKTYDLAEKINLIVKEMKKKFPDFGLVGEMIVQGQEMDDRWLLKIENGIAKETQLITISEKVKCPHCGEEFYPGDVKE
tara:strand:+ start:799 stop:1224 length:426 start_codon:yes stop_codon:yes gene_type:complete